MHLGYWEQPKLVLVLTGLKLWLIKLLAPEWISLVPSSSPYDMALNHLGKIWGSRTSAIAGQQTQNLVFDVSSLSKCQNPVWYFLRNGLAAWYVNGVNPWGPFPRVTKLLSFLHLPWKPRKETLMTHPGFPLMTPVAIWFLLQLYLVSGRKHDIERSKTERVMQKCHPLVRSKYLVYKYSSILNIAMAITYKAASVFTSGILLSKENNKKVGKFFAQDGQSCMFFKKYKKRHRPTQTCVFMVLLHGETPSYFHVIFQVLFGLQFPAFSIWDVDQNSCLSHCLNRFAVLFF